MTDKPAEPSSTTKEPSPAPAPAESAAVASDVPSDVPVAGLGEKPEQRTDAQGSEDTTHKKDEGEAESVKDPKTEDDVEMKDANDAPAPSASEAAGEPADEDATTSSKDETAPGHESMKTPAKSTKDRRKSIGGSAVKAKTLGRKASKVSLSNVDAQPGDLFLVKLKGFPAWPVIVADESMLPLILIQSRPVSAARSDGTYAEPFADGGKRVNERKLPVMYLHTNEFGWVLNTVLQPLSAEKAAEAVTQSMKNKDLKKAFELAAEAHDLDYYKAVLEKHQRELAEAQKAEEERVARAEAKAKAKAVKEAVKATAAVSLADRDGDLDMPDDQPADESESTEKSSKTKAGGKSKKRKAEEDVAPLQKAEPLKKPKIKLTSSSTPKSSNGVALKSKDAADAKTKTKKPAKDDKETSAKANPVISDEKKKREILFLRHRLQRGLLMKDKEPQAEEMKAMSEHLTKLEGYPDLEAWVIKETKINKVLKAILKIDEIPRESEFDFKSRSNALLEKWNKVLAADLAAGPPAPNGLNGADDGDKSVPKDKDEEERATDHEKPADDAKSGEKSDRSVSKDVDMMDAKKDVEKEEPVAKQTPDVKTVIGSVQAAA